MIDPDQTPGTQSPTTPGTNPPTQADHHDTGDEDGSVPIAEVSVVVDGGPAHFECRECHAPVEVHSVACSACVAGKTVEPTQDYEGNLARLCVANTELGVALTTQHQAWQEERATKLAVCARLKQLRALLAQHGLEGEVPAALPGTGEIAEVERLLSPSVQAHHDRTQLELEVDQQRLALYQDDHGTGIYVRAHLVESDRWGSFDVLVLTDASLDAYLRSNQDRAVGTVLALLGRR